MTSRPRASFPRVLVLALVLVLGTGLATSEGQPRSAGLVLSTPEGRVLRARLASGAVVELHGEMEVRFQGESARVTFLRATDGIAASTRAEDVEVRIAREVWSADQTIGLGPRAHVVLRSVGARDAILEARGLGVSVQAMALPRDAIVLPSRSTTRTGSVVTPEAWTRVDSARRAVLGALSSPRRAPRGRPLALARSSPIEVGVVEEVDGWARIALEDSGIRVLAWVEAAELTEPVTRPPSSGGGGLGLGDGRIGLSRCGQDGSRTMYTRSSERVWRDASARVPLTTVHPRVSVVVRDGAGPRLAVLELPGVQRVGRCERPIGWIARAALDATREEPIDED